MLFSDNANPYSPAADESSYVSGLSETVLIAVICFVVLLVCFMVGLAVHRFYKKRNIKRVSKLIIIINNIHLIL